MKLVTKNSSTGAEILCYGDIGGDGISASEFAGVLQSLGSMNQLTVGINSAGGDCFEAMAIFNLLTSHPAKITTRVDGLAASAASVILMAGNVIQAAPNSIVMVHRAWTVEMGNAQDMRQAADILDKIDDQIANTYVKRTGKPLGTIRALMKAETWMTADEAKTNGFVNTITGTAATASAKLDANRFQAVPAWVLARTERPTTTTLDDVIRQHNAATARHRKLGINS